MKRVEWLKQMRDKAEKLYDHFSPLYWVKYGLSVDETHREYLHKFLQRLPPRGCLLSAACGAGKYDGMLLKAGHSVVGVDQSEGMLARAKEHFPKVRYERIGLQELDFQEMFDGVICIDGMEHICPEDWPGILLRLQKALKQDGVLYFTVDLGGDHIKEAYERAKAQGLPVVFGEVVDKVEETLQYFLSYKDVFDIPEDALVERADVAVYHYHPSLEQVRVWVEQAGMTIQEEGTGTWYEHFVVRKR